MKRLFLVCLLGLAGTAAAYVLPGGAILRRLVDAREELHLSGARVEGTLSLSGGAMGELGQAFRSDRDLPCLMALN